MENRRVKMNEHTNLLKLKEHIYPLVDVETLGTSVITGSCKKLNFDLV